jgi:hypothetical protein
MASDERRLYKGTPAGVTGGGEVKRERPQPGISKLGRMGLNLPERADLTQLAVAGSP